MRIFALSDLHVDYEENLRWVENLSQQDYVHDILILAGDVSHDQDLFIRALEALRSRFYRIFFVPGNHDLWLRSTDTGDSLTKHHELLGLCQRLEIQTAPENVDSITIVPLQAWYVEPEEDPQESLFVPKHGEDPSLSRWVDRRGRIRRKVFLCPNTVKIPACPDGLTGAPYDGQNSTDTPLQPPTFLRKTTLRHSRTIVPVSLFLSATLCLAQNSYFLPLRNCRHWAFRWLIHSHGLISAVSQAAVDLSDRFEPLVQPCMSMVTSTATGDGILTGLPMCHIVLDIRANALKEESPKAFTNPSRSGTPTLKPYPDHLIF